MFEDVLKIEPGGVFHGDISGSGAEMCNLCEPVNTDEDSIEAVRGRKFHDEVH